MSDIEDYNSDNDSGSDNSDEDLNVSKKKIFKPLQKKTSYEEGDDSEPDDNDADGNDSANEEDEPEDPKLNLEDEGSQHSDVYEDDDDDDVDDEDIEINEDEPVDKTPKKSKTLQPKKTQLIVEDDEDEDYDFDDNYLQKFDNEIVKNYINEFHPECLNHNYDEIAKLSIIKKNEDGIIVDPLHKTIPYLTKYEKTRILGQRAKQIENGAKPFIKVPENIIDSYIIAELELKEKKIPFIIRRPIPGGGCEYWNIRDLENIGF
jgi:DNA-directed RNA polymerase I, II, and III subunit RPABC2